MGFWAAWCTGKCPCPWKALGTRRSLRSLPTQAILWICEIQVSQCSWVPSSRFVTKLRRKNSYSYWFVALAFEKNILPLSACSLYLFLSYIHPPLSNNLAISPSCTENLGPESLRAEAPGGERVYLRLEYNDITSYLLKGRETTWVQKWSNSSVASSKTMELTSSGIFTFLNNSTEIKNMMNIV